MQPISFVIIEGIDGSGKSTIVRALLDECAALGLRVFDIPSWSRREGRLPLLEECRDAEVIFSAEPTQVWVGAAVRNELIREGGSYDIRTLAEAYALDRLLLYKRLVLPLRAAGKLIIQDRSVGTSLVYQTLQPGGLPLAEIKKLTGNALALENAPELLLVADCAPEVAIERLTSRRDKRDRAIFEKLEILRTFRNGFNATWFQELWREHGTRLSYIDANVPIDEMREAARVLLHAILQTRHASRVLL